MSVFAFNGEVIAQRGTLLGEVKLFAGDFTPRGWALCNGQLLAVSQHEALFALLSNRYGGNGITTFQLPDLRGRTPIGSGTGTGLSSNNIGGTGGSEYMEVNDSFIAQEATDGFGVRTWRTDSKVLNRDPYITLNYIICLSGNFPGRN